MPRKIHTYNDKDWSEWLYYDETSPTCLRWKVRRGPRKVGDVAGNPNTPNDYMQIHLTDGGERLSYAAHRIVYQLHNPQAITAEVDHEDQDSHNNRIGNLVACSAQHNSHNKGKMKNNTSGVTGVGLIVDRCYQYWAAQWYEVDGTKKIKKFSVLRFGDKAFDMACEHRAAVIARLNTEGADYTEGHGL
jgi:hypothetical protein